MDETNTTARRRLSDLAVTTAALAAITESDRYALPQKTFFDIEVADFVLEIAKEQCPGLEELLVGAERRLQITKGQELVARVGGPRRVAITLDKQRADVEAEITAAVETAAAAGIKIGDWLPHLVEVGAQALDSTMFDSQDT